MSFDKEVLKKIFNKPLIKPYKNEVLHWVESAEFQKYSKHSFPPLLNPKTINYEAIPSKVAWELNLPLPMYYQFLFWGSHGCGNTGFEAFIAKYGGMSFYITNTNNGKQTYNKLYKEILKYKEVSANKFNYLVLRNYITSKDSKKFHALIYANKSVCLIRDPISMLKSSLNAKRFFDKSVRVLNLCQKPEEIISRLVGYGRFDELSQIPRLDYEELDYWISYRYKLFHDSLLYKELININEHLFLDMQDITGDRSFDTMQKLAKYCSFNKLSMEEKRFFNKRVSDYDGILPLTLKTLAGGGQIFLLRQIIG